MKRWQWSGIAVGVLALVAGAIPYVRSQGVPKPAGATPCACPAEACAPATADGLAWAVYNLGPLSQDSGLGPWLVNTIPACIQPGQWDSCPSGKRTLRYVGPTHALVVCNTPAVLAQVRDFLDCLKRPAPAGEIPAPPASITLTAGTIAPPARAVAGAGYPIPVADARPKHLFHFVIRYEGDGVIDTNVAQMVKAISDADAAQAARAQPPAVVPPDSLPVPPPPPPAQSTVAKEDDEPLTDDN